MVDTRWCVTYTTFVNSRKKAKHKGSMVLRADVSRIVLYDQDDHVVDVRPLEAGELIYHGSVVHLPSHIVDVGERITPSRGINRQLFPSNKVDIDERIRPSRVTNRQPLIKEFIRFGAQFVGYHDYASKAEEKLAEANERANALAQKLEQSEEARKKAESDASKARAEADKAKADAAGVEELRKRLHDAETSLSEHIAAQSAREEAIIKRLKSQNRRFVNTTSQEFELEDPDNDPLLDALAFLEFHGTETRDGINQAKEGLSRLFPYFFPKKEEPATFLALAKCFNPPEDLGLKLRQENMKVDVERTVALVADSQQNIDWTKVGDTQEMETTKWRSLIKAAKPNTKKILAYLGFKPTPAPSSSKPEV
ncbi:hypothetical protein QYE76_046943 [Lolium multiflorum]|uniref:Uncharacterized protein n=1 Tax=Lolium multiflorum TaxID=4521 RepID=A0AAD8TNV1_LOLMU|nr:hypothetical protein QYE76_046943 [Lolium multiflorum]